MRKKASNSELIYGDDGVVVKHFGRENATNGTIVAFNGLDSGVLEWGDLPHHLAEYYHVAAIDPTKAVGRCAVSGYWQFMPPLAQATLFAQELMVSGAGGEIHMDEYAEAAYKTIIDPAYGITEPGRPVLGVGYSFGAYLLGFLLKNHPSLVANSAFLAGSPGVQRMMPSVETQQALRRDFLDDEAIEAIFGGKLGDNPRLAEDLGLTERVQNPEAKRLKLGAMAASLFDWHQYLNQSLPNQWLSLYGMPSRTITSLDKASHGGEGVIVIGGSKDPLVSPENVTGFHESLPKSNLRFVADGHGVPLTSSEEVAELIIGDFATPSNLTRLQGVLPDNRAA